MARMELAVLGLLVIMAHNHERDPNKQMRLVPQVIANFTAVNWHVSVGHYFGSFQASGITSLYTNNRDVVVLNRCLNSIASCR
jgi:hypothetical protein